MEHGAGLALDWKLSIPAQLQFLVWVIMHKTLPTNALRHSRGLAVNPYYNRCTRMEEDIFRCLRDRPFSCEAWCRRGLPHHPNFFLSQDASEWVKKMALGNSGTLFLAGICWIWCWRNNIIFGEEAWSVRTMVHRIRLSHDEFVSTLANLKNHCRNSLIIHWQAPQHDLIKLNVDGSFFYHSLTMGSGGLARNSSGDWLFGFSCGDGDLGDPLLAELLAVEHGLSLA